MKRTRHSAEQIVTTLREADAMIAAGRSVAQIVQALGVGEQQRLLRDFFTATSLTVPEVTI